MTTEYTRRVTIACPESYITDCNELMCVLGEATADRNTLNGINWRDINGNQYAVSSTSAKPVMLEKMSQPLVAPSHTPDVDLAAASRAQDILVFGDAIGPSVITITDGDNNQDAIQQIQTLGLFLIDTTEN